MNLYSDTILAKYNPAKDLNSLAKSLEAKGKATNEFSKQFERIVNEHFAETGIKETDSEDIKALLQSGINKIMSA